ncbi:PLAC8-domain-containing protein [Poronia punctata]|nr:PLAC8-domain-containing protein [Poronia punctata]
MSAQDKVYYENPPQYGSPVPQQQYGQQQQQHPQQQYGVTPDQQQQQHHMHHPPTQAHAHAPAPAHAHVYSEGGEKESEWQASLCSCSPCGSCLLAWCIPCILLGQTTERMRDPSMESADMLNSDCMIHGGLTCFTGCGWIYAMIKRGEIREKYNIKGSGCNDCCVSFWCSCCALIQQDNEVKQRTQNARPIVNGYQSQPGMQVPH